ncbi:MAG: transglutaminase domain-containing protein [Methanobrevibacter sp.]|nr:transglutaminase domain-containing protein [Methanobrevibacter sp.]
MGVIAIFALVALVSMAPLETSISNTQNNIDNLDVVTVSASTQPVNNTKNLTTSKNQTVNSTVATNKTKVTKKVIKVTKMPLKDYRVMVSAINKHKKLKGVQPKFYTWKANDMQISRASYRDAIKRHNRWVKANNGVRPIYVNIFNGVKHIKVDETKNNTTNDSKNTILPTSGGLSGFEGLAALQKYMNANFNHQSGGPSTYEGVVKAKVGDCWGLAEWAGRQLKSNGYEVRIVQGASSASSSHRWVQVRLDGKWINFESSLITKRYGSKHYSTTCASVNKIVRYL